MIIAVLSADELDSALKGWQHMRALGPYYVVSQLGIRSQSERVQGALVCASLLVYVGAMINALAAVR